MRDPLLDPAAIDEKVAALDGWEVRDGCLHVELAFADFSEAFGFMARVALAAEKLDHHPDWSNSWNRVVIDVTNHDSGGLTARCFDLASRIDAARS